MIVELKEEEHKNGGTIVPRSIHGNMFNVDFYLKSNCANS